MVRVSRYRRNEREGGEERERKKEGGREGERRGGRERERERERERGRHLDYIEKEENDLTEKKKTVGCDNTVFVPKVSEKGKKSHDLEYLLVRV